MSNIEFIICRPDGAYSSAVLIAAIGAFKHLGFRCTNVHKLAAISLNALTRKPDRTLGVLITWCGACCLDIDLPSNGIWWRITDSADDAILTGFARNTCLIHSADRNDFAFFVLKACWRTILAWSRHGHLDATRRAWARIPLPADLTAFTCELPIRIWYTQTAHAFGPATAAITILSISTID